MNRVTFLIECKVLKDSFVTLLLLRIWEVRSSGLIHCNIKHAHHTAIMSIILLIHGCLLPYFILNVLAHGSFKLDLPSFLLISQLNSFPETSDHRFLLISQ